MANNFANPFDYYIRPPFDEHTQILTREEVEEFERQPDGIQGWMHTYKAVLTEPEDHADLREFQRERKRELLRLMELESRSYQGRYNFKFEVEVKLGKLGTDGEPDFMDFFMRQEEPKHVNYDARRFDVHAAVGVLDRVFQEQNEKLKALTDMGSGWKLLGISRAYFKTIRCDPLRGGAYFTLPKFIRNKKAVINIKNKDDKCLRWVLKAAKFPVEQNVERPSKYPKDEEDGLDFTGISFPTPLKEIPKVEQLSRVRINVFGYNDDTQKINILFVSDRENEEEPTVNVLMAHNNEIFHYCLVKSLSALLFAQQHASPRHVHYCERCLRGFSAVPVLQKHKENCKSLSRRPTRVEMPDKGKNTLKT